MTNVLHHGDAENYPRKHCHDDFGKNCGGHRLFFMLCNLALDRRERGVMIFKRNNICRAHNERHYDAGRSFYRDGGYERDEGNEKTEHD